HGLDRAPPPRCGMAGSREAPPRAVARRAVAGDRRPLPPHLHAAFTPARGLLALAGPGAARCGLPQAAHAEPPPLGPGSLRGAPQRDARTEKTRCDSIRTTSMTIVRAAALAVLTSLAALPS